MKSPQSFRSLSTLIVSLGVLASACGPTAPEESGEEESSLSPQRQATYGGDLLKKIGTPVATGSTLGKTNEVTPNCDVSGSHSAPDVSYTWTPPYTDTFTLTTAGSSFNTILVVHTYHGNVLVGCNDNASTGTTTSALTLSLTAGTAYIITVDGAGSSSGTYSLNINSVSCPGGCQPPQNGCYGPNSFCDTTNKTCIMTYLGPGTSCNDNNACTTGDVCDGFGGCGGTTVACNTPPSQCYQSTGTCNASTGQCSYVPMPTGTACNDGNACTLSDTCDGAGTCGGGTVKSCNTPPSQCYQSTGTCNASTGQCSYAAKPTGTACNDGNACTLSDTCNGLGTCRGGTTKSCSNSPGQCYQSSGTCNTSTGYCSYSPKPAGTACNDGNACTYNDTCNGAGFCGTGSGGVDVVACPAP